MFDKGLEELMLPCVSKTFFGLECLGCGAQRATVFLFKGEFVAAFKMYPAIYPILLFIIFIVLTQFFTFKNQEIIKIVLVVSIIVLVLANYIVNLL